MPRNLIAETLRRGLYTRVVGKRILFFQELSSTMDEARRQADAACEEGTLVIAETQTASRGRFARTWVSQPGNLYLSAIFYPSLAALPFLSSLGGVAVARAIRRTTGLQPKLKWPNDVQVGGSKVAGILVESVVEGSEVKYAVLGIGININIGQQHLAGIPAATSLADLTGKEIARDELLTRLLHEIDALYLELRQGQTPLVEWKELLDTLGQRVNVTSLDQSYRGLAEDIDELGNLQVRLDDGQLVTVTSGDVTLSAPATDASQ
ncbi:MAG: biotin--[acetyl-CoA-carboxylase] ligase [Chloroflexi bacterium]|nr:biotin--[acetyl-CoA-carboxylase] ligase [Chloroflexota bacterium]MDA1218918.1 biotin--[acetyl-CoA-carboxylase] ligase [Chloroflexota bacterium]PKB56908.1 MAG: biotin--[acetyl-CoA-carboxylase] ligase [SAR202 cluster bacterium Casp-Chloro-G3]